jgi:hypothetical protein
MLSFPMARLPVSNIVFAVAVGSQELANKVWCFLLHWCYWLLCTHGVHPVQRTTCSVQQVVDTVRLLDCNQPCELPTGWL